MSEKSIKKSVIGGAGTIVLSAIAAKAISACFRLPLTNVLGAGGIGFYQLVFPVYSLLIALSGVGVSVAVSRLVAERTALGFDGDEYVLPAIVAVTVPSAILTVVAMVFSDKIALFQGNLAVQKCYLVILPAVVFVAVGSVFRGYFQGKYFMRPTAVYNVLSQLLKLVFGIVFAICLKSSGTLYAVCGALLGVALSEFSGTLYLILKYQKLKPAKKSKASLPFFPKFKQLLKVGLPITLGSIILPISGFIDTFLVVNMLKLYGLTASEATAEYGVMSGAVTSLVNLPVALAVAVSVAVVPSVASSGVERDLASVLVKSKTSLKLAYLVGVPATVLFFALAPDLILLFYPKLLAGESQLAVRLLRIYCVSATPMTLLQIYNSILQALGQTSKTVWNMLFAVAVKVSLSIVLIYHMGIEGYALSGAVFSVVAAGLGAWQLGKLLGKGIKLLKNVYGICVSSVIIGLTSYFISRTFQKPLVSVGISLAVSGVAYVALVWAMKVLDDDEISSLPFLKKTKKIL